MIICEHCLEATRSRGEEVIVLEELEANPAFDEEPIKCEWCEDEFEENIYRIEVRK